MVNGDGNENEIKERLPGLYEKPRNSWENLNGTVHPAGGNFAEKKEYLSRYHLFHVFKKKTEIFCTICLDY